MVPTVRSNDPAHQGYVIESQLAVTSLASTSPGVSMPGLAGSIVDFVSRRKILNVNDGDI